MSPIGFDVSAKRGDLVHRAVPIENADGAELDSHRNRARKEATYLLGGRGGGEVPVQVWVPQQGVPDGAAHTPGLEALLLQSLGDVEHGARGGERGHGGGL